MKTIDLKMILETLEDVKQEQEELMRTEDWYVTDVYERVVDSISRINETLDKE